MKAQHEALVYTCPTTAFNSFQMAYVQALWAQGPCVCRAFLTAVSSNDQVCQMNVVACCNFMAYKPVLV